MEHRFNVEIAAQYDMSVSVFLSNIAFWIHHNSANKINFHDGRYWTYNSRRAFSIVLSYWSEDQIKTIVTKCKKEGLLLTGNYNKKIYDKTNWYTLTDKGMELFPSYFKHLTGDKDRLGEITQGPLGEITQPIPNTKPFTRYKTTETPTQSCEPEDKTSASQEPVVVLSEKAKAAGIEDRDIKKWTGGYSEEKVARAMEIYERTAIVKNARAFIAQCLKDGNWEMPKTNTEGGYVKRDTSYTPKVSDEDAMAQVRSMERSVLRRFVEEKVLRSFPIFADHARQAGVDISDPDSIKSNEVLVKIVSEYLQD